LFNGSYGVMTEPNGLLNMRARFYNPTICRFLNPDPITFSGGINFYAYCNGNPINNLDPFGLVNWGTVFWGGLELVGDALAIGQIAVTEAVSFGAATPLVGVETVGISASIAHAVATIGIGAMEENNNDNRAQSTIDSLPSNIVGWLGNGIGHLGDQLGWWKANNGTLVGTSVGNFAGDLGDFQKSAMDLFKAGTKNPNMLLDLANWVYTGFDVAKPLWDAHEDQHKKKCPK
jgi:RHS repeat-associated protein